MNPFPHHRSRGFTLIELMITVVIVAVLAAVALPAYFEAVRTSRRAEAVQALAQAQQAQERYRANQASYATHFIVSGGNLTGVGIAADTNSATSFNTSGGYYRLGPWTGGATAMGNVGATRYTILAEAQGSQTKDTRCKFMQVDVTAGNVTYASGSTSGVTNSASDNARCWKR